MYPILNVAVGGDWGGPPDETTVFPATMEVDYVRVWKRIAVPPDVTPNASANGFTPPTRATMIAGDPGREESNVELLDADTGSIDQLLMRPRTSRR